MKRKGKGRTRTKSLAALKKTAWKLLSEIVRRTSADQWGAVDCYTCGSRYRWSSGITGMNAGHAIPGRSGAVLLDEGIIRPQCNKCNAKPPFGRGGEYHIFAAKLIKENGMEWWEHKLSESRHIKKWSRVELEEKIQSYRDRLKALEVMEALP